MAAQEEQRVSILGTVNMSTLCSGAIDVLRFFSTDIIYLYTWFNCCFTRFPEQILEPAAKDRISRLALVKKEKARSVEDSLIMAAKNGKLQGKV